MTKTEFGKLKKVIVGRENKFSAVNLDFTFKHFFYKNIKDTYYFKYKDFYSINEEILVERIQDLENLAKTISSFGIEVLRPDELNGIKTIQTPDYKTYAMSPSNIRDLAFIYKDYIIETPVLIRGRIFENQNLNHIFRKLIGEYKWVKAPVSKLLDENIDQEYWDKERDFKNTPENIDPGLDAAQIIKIGEDLICNVATYNHYLGYKWLKSILGTDANIYMIERLCDNHIDGTLLPLDYGVFLANSYGLKKPLRDYLPEKFKKWKIIELPGSELPAVKYDSEMDLPLLASRRGMEINILSLDNKNIMVNDSAKDTCEILYKNNFNVIPVKLRHCELFGGGIHCSTLDLERDD